MNIIDLLKNDHQKINQLFGRTSAVKDMKERRQLFMQIKRELDMHISLEETFFYPVLQKLPGFEDIIEHSYDEHAEAKEVMKELYGLHNEDAFDDRMDELIDTVTDHVEEEENTLFPKVLQACTAGELETIGAKVEQQRRGGTEKAAA